MLRMTRRSMIAGAATAVAATRARGGPASSADAAFAALSRSVLDGLARFSPTFATTLGDHRFDDRLPDLTGRGRAATEAFLRRSLARLATIDRAGLSRDNQVDAVLLDNELRGQLWTSAALKQWQWDPQVYQSVAGGALFSLAARDFAPWPARLKAATARMRALPGLLAAMRGELVPARVPDIHAITVAGQSMGTLDIVEDILRPRTGALAPADRAAFDAAASALKAALTEHQKWLDGTLVPQAKGDFRLSTADYDRKLGFAMVGGLGREEIRARATRALAETRAEMYSLARTILAGRADAPPLPPTPTPDEQQAAIAAALELSYARRPARDAVMAQAKATLAQATAFVRERDLITLPTAPVKVIEVPRFMQGVAVAYCDSPGPLDRALDTFYMVSPIPAGWSEAQVTSYLREYNHYMIHDLGIHEAMPGHYVQIDHSNKARASTLRAVLSSGVFVEGWAVYAEGMMADQGYLADDPLFRLTVLKMRLRTITNSLLDIGIHSASLTREQAMDMMMRGAFQQEREAAGKWVRAQLGAVQLLSYFTGYSEHMALRDEVRRREGAAFALGRYHDAVLAHGSPPVRFARALMLGEPIPEA
jgi:uncharacterized protein (DUF885 family)